MGLSHCRCQDQWTARTLWAAKAAREAEANLCMRRTSASPTASASTAETVRACSPSLRKSLLDDLVIGRMLVQGDGGPIQVGGREGLAAVGAVRGEVFDDRLDGWAGADDDRHRNLLLVQGFPSGRAVSSSRGPLCWTLVPFTRDTLSYALSAGMQPRWRKSNML